MQPLDFDPIRDAQLRKNLKAFADDLPKQLAILSYAGDNTLFHPKLAPMGHLKECDEDHFIPKPLANAMSGTEIADAVASGFDPYAIGLDYDDDLDACIAETNTVRNVVLGWLLGSALDAALPKDSDERIAKLCQIAARGSVITLKTKKGADAFIRQSFSEQYLSRLLVMLSRRLTHSAGGIIAADRAPSLRCYDWVQQQSDELLRRLGRTRNHKKTKAFDTEEAKATMTKEIMGDLCGGQQVIVWIDGETQMPDQVAAMVTIDLILPAIRTDDVIGLLHLTHSTTGLIAVDQIRRRLPRDEKIASLPASALVAAFALPTTLQVADLIADQAKLHDPGSAGPDAKGNTSTAVPESAFPKLADLKGQPAATRELSRLVADIEDWRAGKIKWSEIETSMIFHGPPGTGKSMAATVLANELRIPLIDGSMGKCQAKGPLSDTLKASDAALEEARKKAPSVFLMDELDSLMDRRRPDNGYMRSLVNAQLEALTRIQGYEGVILVGTTNNLDDIDPAITRSGRFDIKVLMARPDLEGLTAIVRNGLADLLDPGVGASPVFDQAMRRMIGLSGADAAVVARRAKGVARQRFRLHQTSPGVTADDLLEVVRTTHPAYDERNDYTIAVHEAGHAVAGVLAGRGYPVHLRLRSGGGTTTWEIPALMTEAELSARVVSIMAGGAAEEVLLGVRTTGAGHGLDSDLASATRAVLSIKRQHGFDARSFAWEPVPSLGEKLSDDDRAFVDEQLRIANDKAVEAISSHSALVEHIALALLDSREIDGSSLRKLFEKFPDERLHLELEATYRLSETKGEHHDCSDIQDPPNRRLKPASSVRQAQSTSWSRLS